jgi:hypothetical protein
MIMTKTEMKKARIKECVQVLRDFGCTMIENEGMEFTFDLIMGGIMNKVHLIDMVMCI